MMGIFIVAAAGAAAFIATPTEQAAPDVDPLIGQALPKMVDPSALHAKVRTEDRDEAWAEPLEKSIRARMMAIPLVGKGGNVLRVTCASTLCEISGSLLSPTSEAEIEDQHSRHNLTVRDLQVAPLTDDLQKLGLKHESGLFTAAKSKPDRTVFLLHYSRKD